MTLRTYIISCPSSDHLVDIRRWAGAFGDADRITIQTNQRSVADRSDKKYDTSVGMSLPMADQLTKGLLAVLSGHFDRACTEAQLRIETQAALRLELIAAQSPQPTPQPELDAL